MADKERVDNKIALYAVILKKEDSEKVPGPFLMYENFRKMRKTAENVFILYFLPLKQRGIVL